MYAIRIVGQPTGEDAWLHRFRNFGEEVWVQLRDSYAVSIEEIDAAVDTFHIRDVPAERFTGVADTLARKLGEHHLDDSVFIVRRDSEDSGLTVVLVVDPALGDGLWDIAARHDAWVVPSEINRAAIEEIWAARKEANEGPSLTIWSAPPPTVTERDWLAILDTIELHHGEYSSEPPLDTLSVYDATVTPPITAALREYGYEIVKATKVGFVAFKGPI